MITLAAVILAVGALAFTLAVRAVDVPEAEPASPHKPSQERRAALEEGLRDLEFEYRLGKLSEDDYQQARQEMERELAQLGAPAQDAAPAAAEAASANLCPHCGARFAMPLKFCGECGKPMRREAS